MFSQTVWLNESTETFSLYIEATYRHIFQLRLKEQECTFRNRSLRVSLFHIDLPSTRTTTPEQLDRNKSLSVHHHSHRSMHILLFVAKNLWNQFIRPSMWLQNVEKVVILIYLKHCCLQVSLWSRNSSISKAAACFTDCWEQWIAPNIKLNSNFIFRYFK